MRKPLLQGLFDVSNIDLMSKEILDFLENLF